MLIYQDNATRSLLSSPTAANLDAIAMRGSNALGRALFAPVWLAVRPSFLPRKLPQEGPPNLQLINKEE